MASEKQQKAVDLSHHLSDLARRRKVSPLKGMGKYAQNPNIIALAGGTSHIAMCSVHGCILIYVGLPHPSYFPFADVSANGMSAG